MNDVAPKTPLQRILETANRRRLDDPFRSNSALRARYFPGAGKQIPRARLVEAYVQNYDAPDTDWQLLAHATWTWIEGHAADLKLIEPDLQALHDAGKAGTLSKSARKQCVERFTQEGADEIDVFVEIFNQAGPDYRKAVLEVLGREAAAPEQLPTAKPARPAGPAPNAPVPGSRPETVNDLDPLARTRLALIGSAFLFALSLVPVIIQYVRLPDESHEIVLAISGVLLVLVIAAFIDYKVKRRGT